MAMVLKIYTCVECQLQGQHPGFYSWGWGVGWGGGEGGGWGNVKPMLIYNFT